MGCSIMNEQQALLDQLHGLQLPETSIVPALGWWLLVFAILLAIWGAWRWRTQHHQRYWYREAKQEIQLIRQNTDRQPALEQLQRCSMLARKLALQALPRAEAASPFGPRWLQMLDSICGKPVFSSDLGKLLIDAPYQASPNIKSSDINDLADSLDELADAVRRGSKVR